MDICKELKEKGYCIIPDVLSSEEVDKAKELNDQLKDEDF